MIDVTLRVRGVDLLEDSTAEVIAQQFPDTAWTETDGFKTVTIFVDREDAVSEAVRIVRSLETAIPGLLILGVHRDLVGISDIAHRVGVSREGARKWTLSDDFPAPFDYIGSGSAKVWIWAEVVEWLEETRGLDLDESLPSAELMTQIENCIMRNPDSTTVQWHQVLTKTSPVQTPHFQSITPAVRLAAGGRAQRIGSREDSELVGAVAHTPWM